MLGGETAESFYRIMETKVQNNCVIAVQYIIQTLGKLWLAERKLSVGNGS